MSSNKYGVFVVMTMQCPTRNGNMVAKTWNGSMVDNNRASAYEAARGQLINMMRAECNHRPDSDDFLESQEAVVLHFSCEPLVIE